MPLNTAIITSLSLALLVAVWAFAREVRLRRGLQAVLARLFAQHQRRFPDERTSAGDADTPDRHDRLC